jgi:hypothetical protein
MRQTLIQRSIPGLERPDDSTRSRCQPARVQNLTEEHDPRTSSRNWNSTEADA